MNKTLFNFAEHVWYKNASSPLAAGFLCVNGDRIDRVSPRKIYGVVGTKVWRLHDLYEPIPATMEEAEYCSKLLEEMENYAKD